MKQLITLFILFVTATTFAQNVGIGTTTPDEKLQVDSVIRIGKNAIIPTGSTRKNTIKFGDGNFATIGEQDKDDRLVLNAGSFSFRSGNVGVGLDSATEKLDVAGDIKADTILPKAIRMATNASVGKVLTSDATGNALWATPTGIAFPYTATINNATTLFALSNSLGNCFSGYSPSNTAMYAVTSNGQAVAGSANAGVAVYGYSNTGTAGNFESPSGTALKTTGDVEITGSVKIVDGTQGPNKILTSDVAGNATWVPNANATVFTVSKDGTDNQSIIPSNTPVKINFNTGTINQSGNAYNHANSEFTAPANGYYHFDVALSIGNSSTNSSLSNIFISLYKRYPSFPTGYMFYNHQLTNTNGAVSSTNSHNLSATVYLLQSDVIDVRVLNQSATNIVVQASNSISNYSFFSGYRIF